MIEEYIVYGALRRPSCFTTQLPSEGNPGVSPWDPFQPAAIYATAYKKPAFSAPCYAVFVSELTDVEGETYRHHHEPRILKGTVSFVL